MISEFLEPTRLPLTAAFVGGGFALCGVLIGMFGNAWIAASQRRHTQKHDRKVLMVALLEEMKINHEAATKNAGKLATPPPGPPYIDVPEYEISEVYTSFLPKLGLLEPDHVQKIMKAYLTMRQAKHVTKALLASQAANGSIRVPVAKATQLKDMNEEVADRFDTAINAIRSVT